MIEDGVILWVNITVKSQIGFENYSEAGLEMAFGTLLRIVIYAAE